MSLRHDLNEYLATRRTLGVKLDREGKLLPGFIDFLEASGGSHITSRIAVAWATQPRDVHPAWWSTRLVMVRGFAKYLQAIDPRHVIPPIELLPHTRPRTAPYYTRRPRSPRCSRRQRRWYRHCALRPTARCWACSP